MNDTQVTATVSAREISIVVPTFKERENVEILTKKLEAALEGVAWEVIFVDDDSPDGTADAVKELAQRDNRVRCILRVGRRGLAGATIEGMLSSSAPFIAVMDADLQHDEALLPRMLETLRNGNADLVVGSRYIEGGDAKGLAGGIRHRISQASTVVARSLLGVTIADPMSGFFMIRRDRFEPLVPKLSTQGFKILLDIVASSGGSLRIAELPYKFGQRQHGESKLDAQVAIDYIGLLLAKLTGDLISPRFFLFAAVGAFGVLVQLLALDIGLKLLSLPFAAAQVLAVFIAMTGNFILNNQLTYHDQRLKGFDFLRGLIGFYIVCAFGAVVNFGVAVTAFEHFGIWWLGGLAGAVAGAVWNFAISSSVVWRMK